MHTAAQTVATNDHPPTVVNAGSTIPNRQAPNTGDFGFYSRLSAAEKPEQLKAAVLQALEKLDLDSFRFTPIGVDCPKQLSNWGVLLVDFETYRAYDLVAHHAQAHTSPIFLSAIAEYIQQSPLCLESNAKFLELCRLAADSGHLDVYSIPYTTPMGINCLFSVSKREMEPEPFQALIEAHQSILYLLGDILANLAVARHAAYFFGRKAYAQHNNNITPKQLQILEKMAKGNVTLQGAADAMCISLDTANKHIAAIKTTLGAKTQATAVYRAIVAGLIELDGKPWE